MFECNTEQGAEREEALFGVVYFPNLARFCHFLLALCNTQMLPISYPLSAKNQPTQYSQRIENSPFSGEGYYADKKTEKSGKEEVKAAKK